LISNVICGIDVPVSRLDHRVNCCNEDLSFPYRLWFFLRVGFESSLLSSTLSCVDDSVSSQGRPRTNLSLSKPMFAGPIELSRTAVTVQTTSDQYPDSQATRYDICANKDEQLCDKPHGLGVDDDLESGREKMNTAEQTT